MAMKKFYWSYWYKVKQPFRGVLKKGSILANMFAETDANIQICSKE